MSGAIEHLGADSRPSARAGDGGTATAGRGAAPILRPASRGKLFLLAAITLACYAAANAFWLYLSTGHWLNLHPRSFAADFTNPVTLPDLFERTLNVLTHPWMIVVGGMVLGVVLFAPIMVAVLYRLALALPLAAVALLVGHAPALTVALAIGCVIADQTRLRRTAPFLAGVAGMLPLTLYLYFFSSAGSSSVAVLPIQRWALKAPYVVAVLTAVAAFVIVLNLARLTRYRPGVIWPVLAVMLAAAGYLFAWKVGRDELECQFIAGPLAAGDAVFEPADRRTWIATHEQQGITSLTLPRYAANVLEERKIELEKVCREFLRRFGASPRAPAVAWVLAQCRSLQLDRPALEQGWIKSTAGFVAPVPNEEGLSAEKWIELRKEALSSAGAAWEGLRQAYPGAPQAALASWRLAELDLRQLAPPGGKPPDANGFARQAEDANALLRQAAGLLRDANRACTELLDDWRRQSAGRVEEVFRADPPVPPREYYEQAVLEVRRLLWLIHRNEALANPRSAEAIGAMLDVNRFGLSHAAYSQRLYDLAGRYEDTPMAMNLKLAVALTQTDPQRRADQLILLAEQDQDKDAAIEAAYELGLLLLRDPSLRGRPDMNDPRKYFTIVRDAPENPWKTLAEERLKFLEIAPRTTTTGTGHLGE
jgi:hypothetical protein